jgi:hypothetical protein
MEQQLFSRQYIRRLQRDESRFTNLSSPGQTEFPAEGPQALSVDIGVLVTPATHIELSSQRLVQLSHSCFGKFLPRIPFNWDTDESV